MRKVSGIDISGISNVDESQLTVRIGTLAAERLYRVSEGLSLLLDPRWFEQPAEWALD